MRAGTPAKVAIAVGLLGLVAAIGYGVYRLIRPLIKAGAAVADALGSAAELLEDAIKIVTRTLSAARAIPGAVVGLVRGGTHDPHRSISDDVLFSGVYDEDKIEPTLRQLIDPALAISTRARVAGLSLVAARLKGGAAALLEQAHWDYDNAAGLLNAIRSLATLVPGGGERPDAWIRAVNKAYIPAAMLADADGGGLLAALQALAPGPQAVPPRSPLEGQGTRR